jgi:hypothetical protein
MTKLLKSGRYKLIETKHQIKILNLGRSVYAWVNAMGIGEMLVVSHNPHKTDCILALGRFRLYDVKDEEDLSDHLHLELEVGPNVWQGYLLLTDLPHGHKKRSRIIPTREIVSGSEQLAVK